MWREGQTWTTDNKCANRRRQNTPSNANAHIIWPSLWIFVFYYVRRITQVTQVSRSRSCCFATPVVRWTPSCTTISALNAGQRCLWYALSTRNHRSDSLFTGTNSHVVYTIILSFASDNGARSPFDIYTFYIPTEIGERLGRAYKIDTGHFGAAKRSRGRRRDKCGSTRFMLLHKWELWKVAVVPCYLSARCRWGGRLGRSGIRFLERETEKGLVLTIKAILIVSKYYYYYCWIRKRKILYSNKPNSFRNITILYMYGLSSLYINTVKADS